MTLTTDSFDFVADLVRRRSAIQLERGKEYLVESRLAPLAREAGIGVDEYVRRVRSARREADYEDVVEALTTNETSWFRDAAPFDALRTHVIPTFAQERGRIDRLRLWSAACSTGQEAFSIVMTLTDILPGTPVEVLATDLSSQVLERGRAGRYSQLEVNRGLPAAMLVRHLQRVGAEWRVSDAIQRPVTFARHNLLDAAPAGAPFDVIFLRNVLIYFDLATKRAILERIRRVLRPDGFLVLGAAESTLGVDDAWDRIPVARGSVYRPASPVVTPPRTALYVSAGAAPLSGTSAFPNIPHQGGHR